MEDTKVRVPAGVEEGMLLNIDEYNVVKIMVSLLSLRPLGDSRGCCSSSLLPPRWIYLAALPVKGWTWSLSPMSGQRRLPFVCLKARGG